MQICKWTRKKIPTCSDSALLVDKKSIKVIQVNNFQSLFRLHFLSNVFHGNSSTQQYCHEEFPRKLSDKSVNKSDFLKNFNLYSHLFYHLKYTNSHLQPFKSKSLLNNSEVPSSMKSFKYKLTWVAKPTTPLEKGVLCLKIKTKRTADFYYLVN